MTYATRIIKAHLDHFLGEGWTVKDVKLTEDHYVILLVNKLTSEEFTVTDDMISDRAHKEVVANVKLFFNRYPVHEPLLIRYL